MLLGDGRASVGPESDGRTCRKIGCQEGKAGGDALKGGKGCRNVCLLREDRFFCKKRS